MKNRKCRIVIEFQAEKDGALKFAAQYLDKSVTRITGMTDVTATIDIPEKYMPKYVEVIE